MAPRVDTLAARILRPGWMAMLLAVLASAGAAGAGDLIWSQEDWSGGAYQNTFGVDPEIAPGRLVLESRLDDIRYLASPTAFQGLYDMEVYHDTLFLAASDYPYMFDGADVIAYDYAADSFQVVYQPYESGLHIIRSFGDTLCIPGPDSMDPWHTPGSIYTYDGETWVEKASLPTAVHVCDVERVGDRLFATTGHLDYTGGVWMSEDFGETFTRIYTLDGGSVIRRVYGAGRLGDRLFVQPDGRPPETEVLFSTTDGQVWDTLAVPGLPADRQATFIPWGDSLLMAIHNRLYIWNGTQWIGRWLPFAGYRWCRGFHIREGRLYGGGDDCVLYRWLEGSQWETIGALGLEPATEEIEAIETYYGRLYVCTARPNQGMAPRLYVSACAPTGVLVASAHDFGTPIQGGAIDWDGLSPAPEAQIRFRLRSATSPDALPSEDWRGPDGTPNSWYTVPGTRLSSAHQGDRYFQYEVELVCPDEMAMPVLERVTLEVDSLNPAGVGPEAESPGHDPLSATLRLRAPTPNPAWRHTCLALCDQVGRPIDPGRLAAGRPVLRILDPQGRCVRRLSGDGTAWRWDLCDTSGRPVPAGIYLVRLEVADRALIGQKQALVVLR